MAGEWIAVDIGLPDKPEVLELVDTTGEPVSEVVYRLYRLWSWASVNTADGTARMTLARIARVAGGDADFWRAVADVGWLSVDGETVTIPGWDRRFSQAAKARMQHRDRAADQEERRGRLRSSAGSPCASAQERRGDRGDRGEVPPPPPREAAPVSAADGWLILRAAWSTGPGKPWKPAGPPDGLAERLAEPGWLDEALEAIPRLQGAKYFRTPATLLQFVRPGFVRRLAGGQYDEPKPAAPAIPGDRPSAEEAARRWEQGSREQARRQREAEAEKAKRQKAKAAEPDLPPPDPASDDEFERRKAALIQQLQEAATT